MHKILYLPSLTKTGANITGSCLCRDDNLRPGIAESTYSKFSWSVKVIPSPPKLGQRRLRPHPTDPNVGEIEPSNDKYMPYPTYRYLVDRKHVEERYEEALLTLQHVAPARDRDRCSPLVRYDVFFFFASKT